MNKAAFCTLCGPNDGRRKDGKAKETPTVLTEDEQERLLQQANPRYPTGKRNGTMLRLMLNTGLRLAEVTALKWRDMDLTTGKLMVRQGKDRTLWGSRRRHRPPEKLERTSGGAVWSVQACVHHIERERGHRYVQRMMKRYAAKAGIDKNVSSHTLRHSFATDLYRETSKIRLV